MEDKHIAIALAKKINEQTIIKLKNGEEVVLEDIATELAINLFSKQELHSQVRQYLDKHLFNIDYNNYYGTRNNKRELSLSAEFRQNINQIIVGIAFNDEEQQKLKDLVCQHLTAEHVKKLVDEAIVKIISNVMANTAKNFSEIIRVMKENNHL